MSASIRSPSTAPVSAVRGGGAARRVPPVAVPLGAWLASRLLMFSAIAVGHPLRGASTSVVDALQLWDSDWYLAAAGGYETPDVAAARLSQSNVAFFPAFPLAIRATVAVTGWSPLAAAVAVNLVVGALATVLIWLLMRRISGSQVADRGVALFCFFPGSVVLSMVYAESVLLTFAAGCLLALLSRRWLAAGVLAALAGAARPNGTVLVACCLWAAGVAVVTRRDWRALVAPALAPLGTLGFFAFLWARTGEPLVWLRVQRDGWGERIDFGRRTFDEALMVARNADTVTPTILLQVLGLAVVVAAVVLLVRWHPPGVIVVYTAGVLALALLSHTLGARPRFVATAFPLFGALGWSLRGWPFWLAMAVFASGSAVLAVVYTITKYAMP